MKHVVIAGGGFAGVRLARQLRKQKQVRVTIINKSEDFRYSPALYRAATGFKIGTARIPLEWMLLDSSNTTLVLGVVEKINKTKKTITLEDGQVIEYDYAVMALGAVTTYFGINGLDKHSYGVKTFEEVIELKHHIHDNLVVKDEQNFVVVGAGPTGVELAGALGAYLRSIAKKHKIKYPGIKISLVEAGPRILPQLSERASKKAHKRLQKLGIQVSTDTMVQSETAGRLKTSTGTIKSHNVIWTAGTTNNPFFKNHSGVFAFNEQGKVTVNKHLQSSAYIYVCGDNADTEFSGLALTAIGHANYLARDIKARVNHKKRRDHKERHPVQVVPAGTRWSILQYRKLVLSGRAVSVIRRLADVIGYTDVLGPLKALTIWSNSDRTEEFCPVCKSR